MHPAPTPLNSYTTAKTGRWSSPSTWKGNKVPPQDAAILVAPKHTLTFDMNAVTCGLYVSSGATFTFDRLKSATLDNCENILVYGKLIMKPASAAINHAITFHEIDESKFSGGTMDILPNDVGIWVRDNGTLELSGSPKTAWVRLASSAKSGDTTITTDVAPSNWRVGDEISIAPTLPINKTNFSTAFDVRKITKVQGAKITLDKPLSYDHPALKNIFTAATYTAEVLNLTRNVRIEGKGDGTASPETNGRAHINISMTSSVFEIANVQLRHMGPRKRNTDDAFTDFVLGRYALHFHMCGDKTAGSYIHGVVARDCGSHVFVPHASHGITYRDNIAYNTFEDAFWWDAPPTDKSTVNDSNNILWCTNVAALTLCDPSFRGYGLSGFILGTGLNNTIMKCVAVGNQGNGNAAGYHWPSTSNYTDNVWTYKQGNIAHNNVANGIFVWENDPNHHIINDFVGYHNGANGIQHGAYDNAYQYTNSYLLENGNGILLHANPIKIGPVDEYGYYMSFKNIYSTDPLTITVHTLVGKGPILFKNCHFSKVIVDELPRRMPTPVPGLYDFVNCNLKFADFFIDGIEVGSLIRAQNTDGTCFQINDKREYSVIPKFFNF